MRLGALFALEAVTLVDVQTSDCPASHPAVEAQRLLGGAEVSNATGDVSVAVDAAGNVERGNHFGTLSLVLLL
jgi:hypothetical protein